MFPLKEKRIYIKNIKRIIKYYHKIFYIALNLDKEDSMSQVKSKVKFTYDDAKSLIFVYENMNILNNKTMREIIKPIIGKIIDSLDDKERSRILEQIK